MNSTHHKMLHRLINGDARDQAPGRFLLIGYAGPATPPTHSGAGRIVTLRMRPMSLAERGVGIPTVSLHRLLRGEMPDVAGKTDVTLADYVREIVHSGTCCVNARF